MYFFLQTKLRALDKNISNNEEDHTLFRNQSRLAIF